MYDIGIRSELEALHQQATKVWALLNDRNKQIQPHSRSRAKLEKKAWDLNNKAWELYRDGMKEYDGL
jgi:hypothetical protein